MGGWTWRPHSSVVILKFTELCPSCLIDEWQDIRVEFLKYVDDANQRGVKLEFNPLERKQCQEQTYLGLPMWAPTMVCLKIRETRSK